MNHIFFFIYLAITSGMFSMLEIQSEGEEGWATNFPTWKKNNKWTRHFYGNRPLTGYHLFFFLFILSISHLPYGLGLVEPTWPYEIRILSFIILFFVIEDFLWFVLNPAFGIRKFKAEHIWWHALQWWWIMPRDYWIYLPIGIGLYIWSLY